MWEEVHDSSIVSAVVEKGLLLLEILGRSPGDALGMAGEKLVNFTIVSAAKRPAESVK